MRLAFIFCCAPLVDVPDNGLAAVVDGDVLHLLGATAAPLERGLPKAGGDINRPSLTFLEQANADYTSKRA
jgi:hypothetical protein